MDVEVKVKPELEIVREEEIPHLLFPGEMGAILELTVTDENGKVTDHRIMRSESFVRQFLELLMIQALPIGMSMPLAITDTGGIIRRGFTSGRIFNADAPANNDVFGILAGTGTVVPHINDFQLSSQILHGGTGIAGRLGYGGVTFGLPASDAAASQFTITRPLANASGASITVNEIGLVVRAIETAVGVVGAEIFILIIRDVITGGIAVPNGQTLTVNYQIRAAI